MNTFNVINRKLRGQMMMFGLLRREKIQEESLPDDRPSQRREQVSHNRKRNALLSLFLVTVFYVWGTRPPPPTPYEQRNPGWNLPDWARKKKHFSTVPVDDRTCFVHVGKAGGSTLGCALGFHLHCSRHQHIIKNSVLASYTTHTNHNGVNDCPDDVAYYLFTIRNPLERARSAYNYDRPNMIKAPHRYPHSKPLYIDCPFPTLNDFAELGLSATGKASDVCKARAKSAIRGEELFGMHFFYNYAFYTRSVTLTDEGKKVLVIRTEHMADDWSSAEVALGGKSKNITFPHRNKGKAKAPEDTYLSTRAQKILCRALCNEMQIYKGLLHKGLNLKAEQVEESLAELAASCPVEARSSSCPEL
jgi:hypothetical protein